MKRVSKRTAILATKLGYADNNNNWTYYSKEHRTYFSTNAKGGISGKEDTFKQCTQTELQAWLRKKGIETWVSPFFNKGIMYQANAHKASGVGVCLKLYHKYEKSMEISLHQGLLFLLEN